ncbi:protein GPR15LG [Microcebus murinus]|uniref:G protein-coupled receptor 15 ligand n=1 Tax=Microcebus murinus TaxID=30608 RepID=A0A8C5Y9Z6_MICMU|nr:secreted protein C10orf99 homolog [Microcebus murinus]
MRLLVLSSLLCILLLCSVFSAEGRRRPAKPSRLRPCCQRVPSHNPTALRGYLPRHRARLCRLCKLNPGTSSWVVPGALPQV